jgi:hypothetical protein
MGMWMDGGRKMYRLHNARHHSAHTHPMSPMPRKSNRANSAKKREGAIQKQQSQEERGSNPKKQQSQEERGSNPKKQQSHEERGGNPKKQQSQEERGGNPKKQQSQEERGSNPINQTRKRHTHSNERGEGNVTSICIYTLTGCLAKNSTKNRLDAPHCTGTWYRHLDSRFHSQLLTSNCWPASLHENQDDSVH